MQPRFISFEGIDGSGKSSQARRLAERLRAQGRDVVLTREPGGAPGAEEIRALVLTGDPNRWSPETEIALFTASRRDHLERTIRPALDRGATVITDRFADSTRVYQGATRGDLRRLVDDLHDILIGTEPDLTLIFDMDPAEALERGMARLKGGDDETKQEHSTPDSSPNPNAALTEDRFETFGLPFQQTIRDGFRALAAQFPDRCRLIDASGTQAEVAARVDAALAA